MRDDSLESRGKEFRRTHLLHQRIVEKARFSRGELLGSFGGTKTDAAIRSVEQEKLRALFLSAVDKITELRRSAGTIHRVHRSHSAVKIRLKVALRWQVHVRIDQAWQNRLARGL